MTDQNDTQGHEKNPVIDSGLKALYVAAGLTDVLAERLVEYAENKQTEAKARQARARAQFTMAGERIKVAPQRARNLPEQVQEQVETLLKDLNLNFDEMARRGEERLHQVREQAAAAAKKGARKGQEAADDAAAKAGAAADKVAPDEEVVVDPDVLADQPPHSTSQADATLGAATDQAGSVDDINKKTAATETETHEDLTDK